MIPFEGQWPDKDKDDVLDFWFEVKGFDATDDIIATSAEVVEGAVVRAAHNRVPGRMETVTRLTGGTVGEVCRVRVRVQMQSGQSVDATMSVNIIER